MRKTTLTLIIMAMAGQLWAQDAPGFRFGYMRAGGGYGILYTPSLDAFERIPTADTTEGGGSADIQVFLGHVMGMQGFMYGLELSFLRNFRYEYHVPITTEVTLNSFPLLLVGEYRFMPPDAVVVPFVQAGIGAAYSQTITETGADSDTETSTDFALMAGPGASFRLSERFSMDILVQYYTLFTESENTTRLNFALNAGYRF